MFIVPHSWNTCTSWEVSPLTFVRCAVIVGLQCRWGLNVISGSLRREEGRNQPQQMSWLISVTYHLGLPLLGPPSCFSLSTSFIERDRAAHIPLERGGVTATSSSLLRWVKVMLVVPTSLNRGEGHFPGWLWVIESKTGECGGWWNGCKMNETQP